MTTTPRRKRVQVGRAPDGHADHYKGFLFRGVHRPYPPAYLLSNLRHWVDTCKPDATRDYVISRVRRKLRENYLPSELGAVVLSRILDYAEYRHETNIRFAESVAADRIPTQRKEKRNG